MGFDWGFDYDYNPLRICDLIEELILQVHDLMDQNLRIWFGIFPNSVSETICKCLNHLILENTGIDYPFFVNIS